MIQIAKLKLPAGQTFQSVVKAHGWSQLLPFTFDSDSGALGYVISSPLTAEILLKADGDQLSVFSTESLTADQTQSTVRLIKHMLRLDEDLLSFYELCQGHPRLAPVAERDGGRLLRSATVWEDLIKTICTTNCSWSLTKTMVRNLTESSRTSTSGGRCCFPTPTELAARDVRFFRDVIRAGYRSEYLLEVSRLVADGKLDPERWLDSPLTTAQLKKEIKKIKGCGDYAAENLLKLLGRYDGLALDSWLRAKFYQIHNAGQPCPDATIARHYENFGSWRGLAIWCDLSSS